MNKDKIGIVAGISLIALLLFGYSAYLFTSINEGQTENAANMESTTKRENTPKKNEGTDVIVEESPSGLTVAPKPQINPEEVRKRYQVRLRKREQPQVQEAPIMPSIQEKPARQGMAKQTTQTSNPRLPQTSATPKVNRSGLGATLVFEAKKAAANTTKLTSNSGRITAEIPHAHSFTEGTSVPLRSLEAFVVEGKSFAKGTSLMATGTIVQGRLQLKVASILLPEGPFGVDLAVYATDGLPGLPFEGGDERLKEAGGQAARNAIRQVHIPVVGTLAIPRKQKKAQLEMPAGYRVYLIPATR